MKRYVIASTILALLAFTAGASANTVYRASKVFYTSTGQGQLRSPIHDQPVASLSLPAGHFVLNADVIVMGSDLSGASFAIVGCSINPIFTTGQMSITPMGQAGSEGMIPLTAVGLLLVPSTVTITCNAQTLGTPAPDGQLLAQVYVPTFSASVVSALVNQT